MFNTEIWKKMWGNVVERVCKTPLEKNFKQLSKLEAF